MGRKALPARAWYDKASKKWHIRDGSDVKFSLSFGYEAEDWETRCEDALRKYLAEKSAGDRLKVKNQESADVFVTDVLAKYLDVRITNFKADRHFPHPLARPEDTENRLLALAEYWAGKTVDEIDEDTADGFTDFLHARAIQRARELSERRWAKWTERKEELHAAAVAREKRRIQERRKSMPEPRKKLPPPPPVFNPASVEYKDKASTRYLEDMRSAITVAVRKKMLKYVVPVPLPAKYPRRQAVFTTVEVKRLIDHAASKRGLGWIDGKPVKDLPIWEHLARFMTLAIYTGSRKSKMTRVSFRDEPGRPWIELRQVINPKTGRGEWRGFFHRLGKEEIEYDTKKAPGIAVPAVLLPHLVKWYEQGIIYPCAFPYSQSGQEEPGEIARAMRKCLREVFGHDTKKVIHTFRHTAATWLVARPELTMAAIAGYLGMSIEVLMRTYSHMRQGDNHKIGRAMSDGRFGEEFVDDFDYSTLDFVDLPEMGRQKSTEIDSLEMNENGQESTGLGKSAIETRKDAA
jgi:integrase